MLCDRPGKALLKELPRQYQADVGFLLVSFSRYGNIYGLGLFAYYLDKYLDLRINSSPAIKLSKTVIPGVISWGYIL
jgi:hypothetical protein